MNPIQAGLTALRGYQQATRDTVGTLTRLDPDTPAVLDTETGLVSRTVDTVAAGVRVSITDQNRQTPMAEYGNAETITQYHAIGMAHTVDVRPGDSFAVTAVDTGGDTTHVGREFVVLDVTAGSWLTERRATAVRRDRLPDGELARLLGNA